MYLRITIISILICLCSIASAQYVTKVGDTPPALSVDEWLKGEPVTSFETGNAYLVEFWGTWCGPCIENIPHLSELQKKYSSNGLIVIGVATHEIDGRSKLDKFMLEHGEEMTYTVGYDADLSMQENWDTGEKGTDKFRLPVCFLIDKKGKIVFAGHPSDKKLESAIDNAVN